MELLKKLVLVAAIFACPAIYAQAVSSEDIEETPDTIQLTQEGFDSAHAAVLAMLNSSGLHFDYTYFTNGEIEKALLRGGVYLSPRIGFEYNYLFGSKTNYPALTAEIGIGYRTKRLDARVYGGIATARYGNYSDKEGKYLAPRLSVEILGEVARDAEYEENFFKIGGEVNYHLRRVYAVDQAYKFDFVGSYPGVALLLEYERQFWGSRSSLTLGVRIGTEYEPGNGKAALGLAGGVYFSYRIGVQKKVVYDAKSNMK